MPIDQQRLTGLFILAVILLIAAYDLWMLVHYGPDATISRVVRKAGAEWIGLPYLIAFGMGCLFGHLFF